MGTAASALEPLYVGEGYNAAGLLGLRRYIDALAAEPPTAEARLEYWGARIGGATRDPAIAELVEEGTAGADFMLGRLAAAKRVPGFVGSTNHRDMAVVVMGVLAGLGDSRLGELPAEDLEALTSKQRILHSILMDLGGPNVTALRVYLFARMVDERSPPHRSAGWAPVSRIELRQICDGSPSE